MFFWAIIVVLMGMFIYKRYIPILNIPLISDFKPTTDTVLLDVRDYQTTFKEPIDGAINIPYAYLNRFYKEIPQTSIIIVATDTVEKNLAIRLLKKRGYQISGFMYEV